MSAKRKRSLGGIFEPMLVSEPLFIRLCAAFVDNLRIILQTAFVIGALLLVRELRIATEDVPAQAADAEPVTSPVSEPGQPVEQAEPVVTDRVRHYLNCTYEAYRADHYAECVEEPSRVYTSPQPGPDDMGHFHEPAIVLLARIEVPTAN